MSIADSLVNWWLDHPGETAASMAARCARLFRVVLSAPAPPALRAD
jgi:hypothetical protein